MTRLHLEGFNSVKIAIQTINNKREVVWENESFKSLFGTYDRRRTKCWKLMHPNNPRCEKCETRGCYVREISKNGDKRQYLVNNSKMGTEGFVKFVLELEQIVSAYTKIDKEIIALKEKLSALLNQLDTIVICSLCKRIRLKDGTWVDNPVNSAEELFAKDLSHGYCPECAKRIISEI